MMQRLTTTICALAAMITVAYGGPTTYSSDKETKQVTQVPPCPEWYRDTEWNVSLWGTYIFTGNNWDEDRYFESDHAWGGGVDVKYFFHRYFGVGVEGWATESTRRQFDGFDFNGQPVFSEDSRVIGAIKELLPCAIQFIAVVCRLIFLAAAAQFRRGRARFLRGVDSGAKAISVGFPATHSGTDTRVFGQVGAGLEVRLTPTSAG
jgi:hypothetical protein